MDCGRIWRQNSSDYLFRHSSIVDGRTGLVDGENERFCDVDMGRTGSCPNNLFRDVLGDHWTGHVKPDAKRLTQVLTGLETFIYLLRRSRVTTVPHNGKLCLDHACIGELLISTMMFGLKRTRLYFRYANGRVDQLSHKGTCEGSKGMFSSSIYTASCIWFSTSDRTEVNNMASLSLFKFYQY